MHVEMYIYNCVMEIVCIHQSKSLLSIDNTNTNIHNSNYTSLIDLDVYQISLSLLSLKSKGSYMSSKL